MVRNTVDPKIDKQLSQLAASLGHIAKKMPSSTDNLEDMQVRENEGIFAFYTHGTRTSKIKIFRCL